MLCWSGYGAYLTSGNQSKATNARSILILDKEFIDVNGSAVIFRFRVDGVECGYWDCDGLEMYVDGVLVMNKVSKQLAFKEFRHNVTKVTNMKVMSTICSYVLCLR